MVIRRPVKVTDLVIRRPAKVTDLVISRDDGVCQPCMMTRCCGSRIAATRTAHSRKKLKLVAFLCGLDVLQFPYDTAVLPLDNKSVVVAVIPDLGVVIQKTLHSDLQRKTEESCQRQSGTRVRLSAAGDGSHVWRGSRKLFPPAKAAAFTAARDYRSLPH